MCFQGSDIETLGSEASLEHPAELVQCPAVEEVQLQDTPASAGKKTFFNSNLHCPSFRQNLCFIQIFRYCSQKRDVSNVIPWCHCDPKT